MLFTIRKTGYRNGTQPAKDL